MKSFDKNWMAVSKLALNKLVNIFFQQAKRVKILNFSGFFCLKFKFLEQKIFHRSFILLHWKTMKRFGKTWIMVSKSSPQKLENFFPAGKKGRIFKIYWFVLSKTQIVSNKSFNRSLILSQWRAMKSFGKNLIVLSKSATPQNWWISFQQARTVEFRNFIALFCLKGKLPQTKFFTGVSFY